MELKELIERLDRLQAKKKAYSHATGMLYYDSVTGAPKGGAENRGNTLAVLSETVYELSAGEKTGQLLSELIEKSGELSPVTKRAVNELWREYERTKKIPESEYIEYQMLLNEAENVWHSAKINSDFKSFAPYLEKIFNTNIRFAGYFDPTEKPYNVMLDMYERGLNTERCDLFFSQLRKKLVPLIAAVSESSVKPDNLFLKQSYPVWRQRQLSDWLMEFMGLNRNHCAIGETEHPFTIPFDKTDVRITTHYYERDMASSLYSVIHEGGHALYELHTSDELKNTCLGSGVSMGIHESQSRFYENIIGRGRPFCALLLGKLRELFPERMSGVTEDMLYSAVNISMPSLIRIEADELTYSLHVMLRYELEKAVVEGSLTVSELPGAWNDKIKEYLGIDVPDDARGVLQDSHWSGGSIGYFPAYALGSAYGAQMLAKMKESIDVDAQIASGDISPISAWLEDKIWKHGSMFDPAPLFESCCGPFAPTYYTDYLTRKFTELYNL